MLPIATATAALAGQLIAAAFAAGLNLYATVAVIGLAARLGWIPPLPPDLRGLSHTVVIGFAAALFLVELVIEKLPVVGAVWTGAHTFVRPAAAAMLTLLAFSAQPIELRSALAFGAALLAFAAHGAQSGLRVALASARRPRSGLYMAAAALLLDLLAIAIAVAAFLHPRAAIALLAAAAVLLLLFGPRLWRAATFGARALLARLTGFFGHRGWKTRNDLPRRIRRSVAPPALGKGEPRAARAAALGLRGAGAYRNGWLLVEETGAVFLFRDLRGTRRVPVPRPVTAELRPGPVTDALRIRSAQGQTFTLFLLKDGPSMDHTMAALQDPR